MPGDRHSQQNWDPLGGGAEWTPKTGAGRSSVHEQNWDGPQYMSRTGTLLMSA